MGSFRQDQWNMGEREGPGGPLPTKNGKPIKVYKEVGKGTLNDPCVTWISNLGLDEATEEGYEAFAKVQCKKLGFSFIWIRSKIHDGGTTRCGITGRKTGYEPGSDQDHITVFLGLLRNWVSLHGHIYVIEDEDLRVPVGLIPISGRWIDKNGQPGRNPELWVWTKQRAQEESESTRQAMNTSWRVATRGKQENRDRSWGNSRLPKR